MIQLFAKRLLCFANISLAIIAAMPARSAEAAGGGQNTAANPQGTVECDAKSKVRVVDGVIVCTVEKKVEAAPGWSCNKGSFENVPIFYSEPSKIADQLNFVAMPQDFNCGKVIGVDIGSPKSIMIYGSPDGRDRIKRFIGSFDLPRERVHMDLWAVQISSANKAKLSDVMDQVQRQVDQTREAMQLTYKEFSELSFLAAERDPTMQQAFVARGFGALMQDDPRLSLIQMLLRLPLAEDPLKNYDRAALDICNFFANDANKIRLALYNSHEGRSLEAYNIQRIFNDDPKRPFRRPFQGFMSIALHQRFDDASLTPKCGDGNIGMSFEDAKALEPMRPDPYLPKGEYEIAWREYQNKLQALLDPKKMHALRVAQGVQRRRAAVLDFAKSYQNFQLNPDSYNPAELAKDASIVDGMLGPIVDAINRDVEDYYIQPTLLKIRQIVGRNRGVEYAEVGRTTIAGINGNRVEVVSGTTTSFDEVTPLRLSKWLSDAAGEQKNVDAVLPNLKGVPLGGAASTSLLGTLPAPQAVALLSALSKEEVSWQALTSGITLNLTPVVLRNQAQATVDVDLTIAEPANKSEDKKTSSSSANLRPLSQISKSVLKSKVYINTWDLFALSSFNNQITVTGRRWYVPLVGTIWEGAFGDIPVLGGWFSFKRQPQNVQHQSIILANTLIVPSAMGMASFFQESSNFPRNPSTFFPPSSYPNSLQITPPNRTQW
ncbi:MAG: hypothetical protein ACKO45_16105 [Cyanobium sp.]